MTLCSASDMFVSVVVPHYDDLENLALCLDSLRRQDWPSDRFEIIVADNNSAAGVAAVRAIACDARVVHAAEQGAGMARNAGAAAARGDIFAFIDADCVADLAWLRAGIAGLEGCDYAGGRVLITLNDRARPSPSEAYEAVFAYDVAKYIEREGFSVTANLFVPRAVFKRVGDFRSGVAEDMDWCWRANALGYRIGYVQDAVVRTPARRRWSELKRKHDRMEREHLLLYSERPGWRVRWLVHAAAVALSPLGHWLRVWRSAQLVGARAKFAALLGLCMIRSYRCWRMVSLLVTTDVPARPASPTAEPVRQR